MAIVLLLVAAFLAGAINSVAGGGTLLTFPALIAMGVPPISANATSTVALVPGSFTAFWGYRDELQSSRRELLLFAVPSLVGGVLGAVVVDRVGDRTFARLVPWLIFGATALFAAQPLVRRATERMLERGHAHRAIAALFQLMVATYGGFFGAGMGIMMLAAMGFLGLRGIHRMNGIKNFAAVCINGVASVTFVILGRVRWPLALSMAVASSVGGWAGAGLARRVGEQAVRRIVVAVGVAIGVLMLIRR